MLLILALSGAPGIAAPGHRAGRAAGRARWSAATCGWTATSPSRAGCWRAGCCGAASSPPPRAAPPGHRRLVRRLRPTTPSLAVVAPVTEEATKGPSCCCCCGGGGPSSTAILDGIVYAGMVGIGFAFTENILYLAAAYNGTDGIGPGGTAALTATFVVRCLFSPFAHPLFTAFIGIGVGHRGRLAAARRSGSSRPLGGYLLAVVAHGALEHLDRSAASTSFVVVYVVLMVPAFVGVDRLRGLVAPLRAAACSPPPSPTPRSAACCPATDIGCGWSTSRPPAAARALRQAVGGPHGRARDARLPAGRHRARLPAPPLPARHRPARLRRRAARSTSRGSAPSALRSPSPDRWSPPMTDSSPTPDRAPRAPRC